MACRAGADKRALIRFVRNLDGTVSCDPTGKRAGRGAYLCADDGCFARARKGRALERALKVGLREDDYLRLHGEFAPVCRDAEEYTGMVEHG